MALALATIVPEDQLDAQIAANWSRHQDLFAQRRQISRATTPELRRIRAELGAQLFEKQALLAGRGCEGQFQPFLRDMAFPVSTAYRLIGRHTNGGKLLSEKLSMPSVELRGQRLSMVLTPHEAVTLHAALAQLPLPRPFDLARTLLQAVWEFPSWPNRLQVQQLWRARPDAFTPEQAAALPRLRLPPRAV